MFGEKKSTLGAVAIIAAATILAIFTACSSDSSSSGPDTTSDPTAKTDTVYIKDTVYVPVLDTVTSSDATPTSSATEQSSATAQPESSENAAPDSSNAQPQSSSAAAPSSSDVTPATPTSSAEQPKSSAAAEQPKSSAAADPNILWSDEFDGTAIDETKWGYNIGKGENGWGNSELEYYTDRPENVYVKDGMLHIRAQKEDYEGSKYTSARLLSQNKFDFTYGTVEARIALPVGKGIWPAFWMLGKNIDKVSWPSCGEIDIIEAINDENVIYGTHHWAHDGSHAEYGNNTNDYYGAHKDLDISEFHIYKMTWTKDAIAMYVDDFKYQEIDIKDASGDMGTFHKPFFFILNVAVGGSWPGFDIDDAQFPTEMQVDYIRVYK